MEQVRLDQHVSEVMEALVVPYVELSGERPKGEDLRAAFQARTMTNGTKLKTGPRKLRFEPDGQITYLHLDPRCGPATGKWAVSQDMLCIDSVERRCFASVVNGKRIELFDLYGVMQIDAVAVP